MAGKSSFLDKVLGRIGRLDSEGLQTVVQHLARERAFLEMLFNSIEDGILVVDEGGRILYFNSAVTALIGLPAETAEGQPIRQLLPELNWEEVSKIDREGGARVIRHEFEVSYPRPRILSVYVAPLDGGEAGSAGLALILHDITEARQQTYEMVESERIQALTLLAGSVAHEIGNPLNALHIHLQLMEREIKKLRTGSPFPSESPKPRRKGSSASAPASIAETTEKLERYLAVAKGEIVRLDYIVTQFLQAIRPSSPRLQLACVNDVVRETLDLLQPEIANRGVIVKEKLSRQIPPSPLDPAQIKQALVNLVKNAIQAMTLGGVLTVKTELASGGLRIVVGDTGGGISQEQINRIFEPFYTTKKKGTGLGLMIVQRIIRNHGGRIELESRLEQGTVFRIWLPLAEKPPPMLEAASL